MKLTLLALVMWGSLATQADPLNGSFTLGNSTAGEYDAQGIFTNPASLPFGALLNGSGLNSSFTWAVNRNQEDSGSIAFSLSSFGFGYERLSFGGVQRLSRYHFGGGFVVSPKLFFGSRLTLNRSDTLNDYTGLTFGLQYRVHPMASVGLTAIDVNQPDVATGGEVPSRWVGGLLIRPVRFLDLSLDVDTLSGNGNAFGDTIGYQAHAHLTVARGVRVTGGYHDTYGWQVGLRLDMGQGTVHSTLQPTSSTNRLVVGMRSSVRTKPSVVAPESTVKIVVNGQLEAEPREATLFQASPPHMRRLIEHLEWAAENTGVDAIQIQLKRFPLGWAEAQELHRALWDLRKRGKSVEAFLGNSDFREYYIASAANRIYLERGSQLDLTGLKFSRLFFKGPLDKLGVEAEIFARGKYKSAPETFTRKSSSPPVREANLTSLRQVEEHLLADLKKADRIKDKQQWARILNMGLYGTKDAVQEKLVDGVSTFPADRPIWKPAPGPLHRRDLVLPPRIAVVHAVGPIMSSRGGLGLGGAAITAQSMRKKLDQAVNDPRTRAIVLRVNSGGGEILPSYQIAEMIEEARLKKPVVVSMGGAAASGGYLISAPANLIVAEPTTMTGSIGVFVGKPNLKGLYDKIDLRKEILTYAPHADLFSWDRPFGTEGRKVMIRLLDNYYEGFVDYVATHRKKEVQEIQKVAQGRVWFGFQAVERGLVDKLGGYGTALQEAARLAHLGQYETWNVTEPIGFFEVSPMAFVSGPTLADLEPIAKLRQWSALLEDSPFLFYTPLEMN